MIAVDVRLPQCPPATQGDIAVLNHESVLTRCWSVFSQGPERLGTALQIVDEENKRNQFLGDVLALDRLVALDIACCTAHPELPDTHLLAARIASMRHHFAQAQLHVCRAESLGAAPDELSAIRLSLDQAMGKDLTALLDVHQTITKCNPSLQNLVALAALYVELGEIEMAEKTYLDALASYTDLSPFPLAWVCFQLGVLWGEAAPNTDPPRAAYWYQQALAYLPEYTHACVHLAEIYLGVGDHGKALALLLPIVNSGDPEVLWRLEQVCRAKGQDQEADQYLELAVQAYEALLSKHELAFADHAAEFYLSDPKDRQKVQRAFDLAKLNIANRSTLRAFELAYLAACAIDDQKYASKMQAQAKEKYGMSKAFSFSPLQH